MRANEARGMKAVPKAAIERWVLTRINAIDLRTTRHEGYGLSRMKRKRVKEVLAERICCTRARPASARFYPIPQS